LNKDGETNEEWIVNQKTEQKAQKFPYLKNLIPISQSKDKQQWQPALQSHPSTKQEVEIEVMNTRFFTFWFSKTARRVRARTPTARRLLIFWRKERAKESKQHLPSTTGAENSSFSLMRSKDSEEDVETRALKTGANASYAARQISAPALYEAFKSIW